MANVYSMVSSVTGYKNTNVAGAAIPLTNASGTTPGPLNPRMFVPFPPPNTSAVGAGGGPVFVAPGVVFAKAPSPVNLTALNETVPALNTSSTDAPAAAPAPSSQTSAVRRKYEGAVAVSLFGMFVGGVVAFF